MNTDEPNKTEPTELEQLTDKWKRAEADFTNYRKDEGKRMQELVKFGNQAIISDVLDALDSLDAVILHKPPGVDEEWFKGLLKSRENFEGFLKKYEVERIASVGQKFDPLLHEAISGQGDTVSQEVRAGYTMSGRVIRPARVVLNNN